MNPASLFGNRASRNLLNKIDSEIAEFSIGTDDLLERGVIVGSEGDDDLLGDSRNNILYGGGGNDIINGTDGDGSNGVGEIDILIGGDGGDTFVLGDESGAYYSTDGVESPLDLGVVVDFEAGVDQIQLYDGDAISYRFASTGSGTVILNNDQDLVGFVLGATSSEVEDGVVYTGEA